MGGCLSKRKGEHRGIIEAEFIASSILGKPAEDDYLAIAKNELEEYRKQPTPLNTAAMNAANYVSIEHAYQLLSSDHALLDNGYVRGPGGVWFLSCTVDMGEVTGQMFDWWLRVVDSTEKFRWSHPEAHSSGEWDLPFHRLQLYERAKGYYVDHVHTVTMQIDKTRFMSIDYDRPSKLFGNVNGEHGTFITARVHASNNVVGWIGIGHMCYIVRRVGRNNILRCCYWLGDINKIDDNSLWHPSFVNWIGNTSPFRSLAIRESLVSSLYHNIHEEMACLKAFLPHYYKRMSAAGNVHETSEYAKRQQQEEGTNVGGISSSLVNVEFNDDEEDELMK